MTTDSFTVSATLPASPRQVYEAWLDSKAHGEFTGGEARIDPVVGGEHFAWMGYIWGTNLELEPYRRIVQSWKTVDFPPGSPESRLEVLLDEVEGGTRITLVHTEIPEGQGKQYEDGWAEHYFEPMERYFSSRKNA